MIVGMEWVRQWEGALRFGRRASLCVAANAGVSGRQMCSLRVRRGFERDSMATHKGTKGAKGDSESDGVEGGDLSLA